MEMKTLIGISLGIVLLQGFFRSGESKSLQGNGEENSRSLLKETQKSVRNGRRIENFVDFTGEGDQLAVESGDGGKSEGKREILGKKKTGESGRDCPNVQKVFYPVVPVIIASLIGLIGAIIISAIARGVFQLIKGVHGMDDMDSDGYGYGRRRFSTSISNFLGYDLSKVDFLGLTKKVLKAIDKVY